jgi:hypothetical protein
MFQQIKKMNEHSASLLLLLLLSADFTFTVLHMIKHAYVPNSSEWIIRVNAYLDTYHFIKLFWIIVLLAYILKSTRCYGYGSWILVFTFFLLDDALLLHQNLGDHIASSLGAYLPQALRMQPRLFELAVLAFAGTFLLTLVAWAYFRSSPTFKKISKDLLLFIGALVFFGIIVDLASAIKLWPSVLFVLDFVEDGGETVVYSLILWYVYLLALRNGEPKLFLHDLLSQSQTRSSI